VLEVQRATLDLKGQARLAEIRASLTSDAQPAVAPAGENAAIENAPGGAAGPVDTTKKAAQPEEG
jgi:hypothetical protein